MVRMTNTYVLNGTADPDGGPSGAARHRVGSPEGGSVDAGGLEVALGRGEVEWIEILPLLDEVAYAGWVTVVRTQGDDRGGDVARGVKYLSNVMFS